MSDATDSAPAAVPGASAVRDVPTPRTAPGRADVVTAGVAWLLAVTTLLSAAALAELDPEAAASVPRPGTRPWWLVGVVVTTQAIALLWRRAHPGPVLLAVAAAVPVAAWAGAGATVGATSVAVLVAAYTLASRTSLRGGLPALVGAAGLVAVGTHLAQPVEGVPALVAVSAPLAQGLAILGVAAVVGVVVATRREAAEARERQAEARSREHGARIEAAVARERAAMARELHDIAAHHLSGIAVMAGAIGRQIDTDPEAAKAGVARVRTETSAMLDELRSLVRLLRDAPGPDDESRVESLTSIPALVERARGAGVDVTLSVLGTDDGEVPEDAVGPLAQLAVHRTVQEALANVLRHAPGARCEVVVDARTPGTLVVSVRNGPPAGPPATGVPGRGDGLGLVGMRERADLTDAHLEHGPQPDGGWLVALTLRTDGPTRPATPADPADSAETEGASA